MKTRTHRLIIGILLEHYQIHSIGADVRFRPRHRGEMYGSVGVTERTIGASAPAPPRADAEVSHEPVTHSDVRLNGLSSDAPEGQPRTHKWELLAYFTDGKSAFADNTTASASIIFTDFVIDKWWSRKYYSAAIDSRCPPQRKRFVLAPDLAFHTF